MGKKIKLSASHINTSVLRLDNVIKKECESCGRELSHDFNKQHLSNPSVGESDYLYFFCEECNLESYVPFKISGISVEIEIEESDYKKLR
jgi:hypothetical protein